MEFSPEDLAVNEVMSTMLKLADQLASAVVGSELPRFLRLKLLREAMDGAEMEEETVKRFLAVLLLDRVERLEVSNE